MAGGHQGSGQYDRVCCLCSEGWVGEKNCGCKQTSDKEIDGVDKQRSWTNGTGAQECQRTGRYEGEINEWNDPVRHQCTLQGAPFNLPAPPVVSRPPGYGPNPDILVPLKFLLAIIGSDPGPNHGWIALGSRK